VTGSGGSSGAGGAGAGGTSGAGGAGGGTGGSGGIAAGSPTVGGCPIFPADNAWNRDISGDPVDANSQSYINSIGTGTGLHPDFGSNLQYGIPYTTVPGTQAKVAISFSESSESDPGPYPIPDNVPIEADTDHHALIVDTGACYLYEIYSLQGGPGSWHAYSGAVWHLRENYMRPAGWTSADAAGLPVLPGLVRYDEVSAGAINHALRFTVSSTQGGYVAPASHQASSSTDPNLPPMGLRVRLKASVDISSYPASARVILTALKKYGMIVADNGSDWFISGASDARFNDDELHTISGIKGSDFEVVQHGPIMH
jgi:hypothetical protein